MAQPSNYSTASLEGIDPTTYYVVSASLTPETPAPPFVNGTMAFGNNGSEFVFVQASTTINLGDFLALTQTFTANGLTSTNIVSSLGCRIASAGAVVSVGASLSYIPAGAYFWAQVRGSQVKGQTSIATAGAGANVQMFTTATAGVITSVTTSSSLAAGLAGIECTSSTTAYYNLTWPRAVAVYSSAGGTLTIIANA